MKNNILKTTSLAFILAITGCKGEVNTSEMAEGAEITSCNCLDLSLDEPYNHFYLDDRTKPFTGTCEQINANGTVILKKTLNKGKLEGPYLEYYDNGQIKHEWNFLENRQHGDQKLYDESGKLIHHSKHTKGDLDTIYVNKTSL